MEALAREQATNALARSQFDQANAVRLSGLPGRRWVALDLLKQAEMLRSREKSKPVVYAASVDGADAGSLRHVALPSQSELRTEAVAALMLNDGRVARTRSGFTHAVSPDGRLLAGVSVDLTRINQQLTDVSLGW